MCGVLGIKGKTTLEQGKILLQMLTHRGQDASGLVWQRAAETKFNVLKTPGYPDLLQIKGYEIIHSLLGSTRYPTYGSRTNNKNIDRYAQPFLSKTRYGDIAVVHNGNVTNIPRLTNKKYESDAEFLTEFLAEKINEAKGNLPKAVKGFMEKIDGSYAIVGLFKEKMFAFRDPRGLRPLVWGKNDKVIVVASESIVQQNMNIMSVENVSPGELIIFDNEKVVFKEVLLSRDHAHCMFEYVYFANPCSMIEGKLVYKVRLNLGRELAERIKQKGWKIDYIVPVPDTSRPATQGLAEVLNVPIREAIIKNRYLQRTFIMKSKNERIKAAKRKYLYISEYIKGKSLLIVDDSIVRGLTSQKIIHDLRNLGAKEIYCAITCPPIRFPCYYGIDFPTDEELIASGHTLEEIKKILDVDGIIYQKLEGLKRSIGLEDLCTACLTGVYPTPFAAEIRLRVLNGELKASSHYEE